MGDSAAPVRPEGSIHPSGPAPVPEVVTEELNLLQVVLKKLDSAQKRERIAVDDASALIELRDALAEAKPEDQGSLCWSRCTGSRRCRASGARATARRWIASRLISGTCAWRKAGKRRDVLIGQRGYVEPGGGVQIVDWRNAPVSRLFYRYEEGDPYEEQLGDRMVEGEIIARRTVTIVDSELRRVNCRPGHLRSRSGHRQLARGERPAGQAVGRPRRQRDGQSRGSGGDFRRRPAAGAKPEIRQAGRPLAAGDGRGTGPGRPLPAGHRRADRSPPVRADHPPDLGTDRGAGSAGSGKTTIGLHRIAYLAFADPSRFKPERMLVVVYQRALATYVSRVLPSLDVPGVPVMTFGAWAEELRRSHVRALDMETTDGTPSVVVRAKSHGAMLKILGDRQAALADWCRAPAGRGGRGLAGDARMRASVARRCWRSGTQSSGPVDLRVTALASWVKDAPLSPQARADHRGRGRPAALAHPGRDRRVGGAADRSPGAGRRLRQARAGRVHARAAGRDGPLVQRARAQAHRRPGRPGRQRSLRPGRRGRRPAVADPPAAARGAGRQVRARSPTST